MEALEKQAVTNKALWFLCQQQVQWTIFVGM
jgi:hypothetical protein